MQPEAAMDRVKRLAAEAGLTEIVESTTHDSPCLRVRGKVLVSLRGPDDIVHYCPLEEKALLLETAPQIYWETDHFKRWPGVIVRLAGISDEELRLRLTQSWERRMPKRLGQKRKSAPDGTPLR